MPTEQTGHIITEGVRAGWIRCDSCRVEFGLLPTPEEIKETHANGEGFQTAPFLTHQGCTHSASPDGCLVAIDQDEVFRYYSKLGHEIPDARQTAASTPASADLTPGTPGYTVG